MLWIQSMHTWKKRYLALAILSCWSVYTLPGENWRTTDGRQFEGRLGDVYGSAVLLVGKESSATLALEKLDLDGQGRVLDFLEARTKTPATWAASTSPVVRALSGKLLRLEGDKLVAFDPAETPVPEFFLAYFSAHWCGPCRRYTPQLVRDYLRLKEQYPDAFELVFVSSDESSKDQLKYAREASMPWPMVKFSARASVKPLTRWEGPGIPCLVVLSRDGDLIYHSYVEGEYVGPAEVLRWFETLLQARSANPGAIRSLMHPAAVKRHVESAPGESRSVQPYLIVFDPQRYQTIPFREFVAIVDVDDAGRVSSSTTEPALPTVLAFQFAQDVRKWLFLPATQEGRATNGVARVRLQL